MGNESSSVELEAAAAALAETSGDEGSYSYHNGQGDHGLDDAVAEFCGFRVLGIQEESPASRVGFVSFFDFILAANGIRLDTRDSTFMELIAQSEEKPMQLDVYNLKSQSIRNLTLTPSRQWAGKGLLGVTIRFDSYEYAEDQLLHVLDVTPQSPAFDAGLCAGFDYLLGTPERVFRDADDLQDEILDALDDALQCYVYNSNEDQVRIVRICPSDKWGGSGVLGAEVGHGVLHRLPEACRTTVGTSIGFVSLSEEAKAATDPYLRQIPAEDHAGIEALSQNRPVIHGTSEDCQNDHDNGHVSVSVDAGVGGQSLRHEEDGSSSQATAPPPTSDLTTTSEIAVVLPASASPFIAAYSPDTQAAAKLRYAARIDPQFPISTVAVLADPAQLG